MAISSFGYDTSVGQQPGPGGWWPGAGGSRGATSGGGAIDYSATGPGASGEIGQISEIINQITRAAQTQANQARIPQAPQLEAKSSSNIASELQGQLPPDVLALLGEEAAQAGVASGSPGGPAGYLRALGLTSLQQEQTGQQNLSAAYARNPGAPIYDPSKQLITPYESAQLGLEAAGLAGRSSGGGGGYAPRGGGSYSSATPAGDIAYPSTAVDSGYVPSAAWATDPQAAWWNSIGYTGSPSTPTLPTGVPSGSQLFPNEGLYVDPATMQAYDYSTGQPVDYFSPATAGTNLSQTPTTTSDQPYDYSQIFPSTPGQ